eukprot:CAMPEP_0181182458 /NCGR_PEP_ID=MMETSP1096-20121128/7902_1 /TAXON_ID=156174 ORGANISM="Chrysochromulina ericina, Strain CCMP281" /NCGR_SAMPLE_ID=MMETSP1096 /ASSEMBLY_ACC=CAM_ASM_000453 /LENGTH=90 /DNA_ID=CAMNT_0023271071 /DNA_START=957 /DNA_END=1229 /DNA_ORIENTATION=-
MVCTAIDKKADESSKVDQQLHRKVNAEHAQTSTMHPETQPGRGRAATERSNHCQEVCDEQRPKVRVNLCGKVSQHARQPMHIAARDPARV